MSIEDIKAPDFPFLFTDSETGRMISDFGWSATPLGPLRHWPQSLRTAVGIVLRSPVPMVLLWGPEGVMLYNDAYSLFAGKRHPRLLGSNVREGWPEVADFNDNVMRVGMAGGTLAYRDQELTLYRKGRPEQVWMNLDYSPVPDETGSPGGVLAVVVETTERVMAERRLASEGERLKALFAQAPGFIHVLQGPDHVFDFVNDAFFHLVGGEREVIGKPLREAFPELSDQGFFEIIDDVYASGEPYVGRTMPVLLKSGSTERADERYVDIVYQPIRDDRGRVTGIFGQGTDVTSLVWAEHAVQGREKEFQRLADALPVLVSYMDRAPELRYRFVNRIYEDWFPHRRDEIEGRLVREVVGETAFAKVKPWIDRALAGETVSFEQQMPYQTGGARHVQVEYVPRFDPSGRTEGLYALVQDITEQKEAEAALRENEARLLFLDTLGKQTAKSADADVILGVTTRMLGEHLGVSVCAYADMEPDQDHFTIRGDWSAPGSPSIVGYYSLSAFGKLAVDNLHDGKPLVLSDIASELPPEEAATFLQIGLAATICMPLVKEGRLTALMAIHDKVPRLWAANDLALLAEVTERSWAHIERVRSDASARLSERRFREELEAKVAERTAALQQSERNIRTVLETSHLYLGLLSPEGVVQYVNSTSLAGIGAKLSDVAGAPYWETPWFSGTPGAPEIVRETVKRVARGSAESADLVLNLPAGPRSFEFTMRPVMSRTGEVIALVPEAVDTTARVHAEKALQHAQKMEAIGNLTGGVAHDFNNLLMAVYGSLELLRKRMPKEPQLLRLLDNALEAARRGGSLTKHMLAFARRQDLQSEKVDPEQFLGGMMDLLQHSLGPMIAIETRFAQPLPTIVTDPNQLASALLNLAVNARDAMSGQGRITIAGREETAAIGDGSRLRPGRYVRISVSDSGEGMDEATLKRATEPFFTTKGVGKGTGLGLSMVHGFAAQSGGTLMLRSEPGAGATAEIWLPAFADGEADALNKRALDRAGGPAPSPSQERLTILAVDDDPLVLMNTVEMLEDLGHEVRSAKSGSEALEIMEGFAFDLLITDHAMPHMTGAQLVSAVRERRPDLPVILATGYAELPADVDPTMLRLAKPFLQSELADAAARAMAGRARSHA
ncbi:hypothetical protein GCM10007036_24520 [Alsobacter metallidurans]|uniref:histidine kinase n=2 Tax=Alsobacter metallidurans TaxID=340221 RepID=A0A917MJZ5_9HYPH|nr:hypothetical protein GCM10007036_24520 [Alsobacter metallidurans]